ncbi:predicted protein [Lodderomyces elongisporus NRRL YB-4239]|uniref:Uncharacterized protein n=1 Tax=Lodderomyces elongisporus (strain ATCC 11503 / CBS 2605 / JCM 1781 / NBRC 1676 / NRRL YB-4239) TaxID=379508 RepID=A5E630_LODEL|nr:predicted protein [Lodderomyces elongisporus NRRL YB-4239]
MLQSPFSFDSSRRPPRKRRLSQSVLQSVPVTNTVTQLEPLTPETHSSNCSSVLPTPQPYLLHSTPPSIVSSTTTPSLPNHLNNNLNNNYKRHCVRGTTQASSTPYTSTQQLAYFTTPPHTKPLLESKPLFPSTSVSVSASTIETKLKLIQLKFNSINTIEDSLKDEMNQLLDSTMQELHLLKQKAMPRKSSFDLFFNPQKNTSSNPITINNTNCELKNTQTLLPPFEDILPQPNKNMDYIFETPKHQITKETQPQFINAPRQHPQPNLQPSSCCHLDIYTTAQVGEHKENIFANALPLANESFKFLQDLSKC